MTLKNKSVMVTGANRGIGQALVEEALKQGAKRVYAGIRAGSTASGACIGGSIACHAAATRSACGTAGMTNTRTTAKRDAFSHERRVGPSSIRATQRR